VVVDAQVADAVNAFSGSLGRAKLLDYECSGLLATTIAACSLTRFQGREQPLGKRGIGTKKGAPHGRENLAVGEHVSLDSEAGLDEMPRPLDATRSRVRGGSPVSGNRPKLAKLTIGIDSERLIERLRGIGPSGERRERTLTIGGDDPHRLRSHRSDSGTHPRGHRADREVLRLNSTADLAVLGSAATIENVTR
jgi:hypothetical protein